jgi:hypothetical protein
MIFSTASSEFIFTIIPGRRCSVDNPFVTNSLLWPATLTGFEPVFLRLRPLKSNKGFIREDSERGSRRGNTWTEPDVISFVIG